MFSKCIKLGSPPFTFPAKFLDIIDSYGKEALLLQLLQKVIP